MKIYNKSCLNSNWYQRISIVQDTEDIKVYTNMDKRYENIITTKTDSPFTLQLENLSEEEKIKKIVTYYLYHNILTSVFKRNKIYCVSLDGRKLNLSLPNEVLEKLWNNILTKYYNDRVQLLESWKDISYYRIDLGAEISFIQKLEFKGIPDIIGIQICDYETEFLSSFLTDKLNSVGDSAIISKVNDQTSKITCGNTTIDYNMQLDYLIKNIILEYNETLENNRKRQRKLEDII